MKTIYSESICTRSTKCQSTVRLYYITKLALWLTAYRVDEYHQVIYQLVVRFSNHVLQKQVTKQPERISLKLNFSFNENQKIRFTSTNSSKRPSGKMPYTCGPNFLSDNNVQTTLSTSNVPRCFWWDSP